MLELTPRDAHPMDLMRTIVSFLGMVYPEAEDRETTTNSDLSQVVLLVSCSIFDFLILLFSTADMFPLHHLLYVVFAMICFPFVTSKYSMMSLTL